MGTGEDEVEVEEDSVDEEDSEEEEVRRVSSVVISIITFYTLVIHVCPENMFFNYYFFLRK